MKQIRRETKLCKTLKQPNNWTCGVYAYCNVMGFPPEEFIRTIGHDGSMQVRGIPVGFHEQELIEAALRFGETPVQIEVSPASILDEGEPHELLSNAGKDKRIQFYLNHYSCVLFGTVGFNKYHAMAWHNGEVYDSSENNFKITDMCIHELHLLRQLV